MIRAVVTTLLALVICGLAAGCMTYRPVVVAQKTPLENDIFGSYQQLLRELPLITDAETKDAAQRIEPRRRAVLQAMLDLQLGQPELEKLKADQLVGEANTGLLAVLAPDPDSRLEKRVRYENELRTKIARGIVAINAELSESDAAAVQHALHQHYVAQSNTGDRIQQKDGHWITKQ